jgi:hypothetical protein
MEPVLTYSEVREVAVLLWLGLLVLGALAFDWGDRVKSPSKPKGRGPVTYCRQHNKPRSECQAEHRP